MLNYVSHTCTQELKGPRWSISCFYLKRCYRNQIQDNNSIFIDSFCFTRRWIYQVVIQKIYKYIHIQIYTNVCTYMYMHTHIYTHIYTPTYTYTHIYTHTHSSLKFGSESGFPCQILSSITIVSARQNFVITCVSWFLYNLYINHQSFPLILLFNNR